MMAYPPPQNPSQAGINGPPPQSQLQLPPPSCPIGLQHLLNINAVYIQQDIEVLELVLQVETNNKYSVFNSSGGLIYRAQENNDFLTLNYGLSFGSSRPFTLNMFDINNNAIRYHCPTMGFQQEVTAIDHMGQLLGSILQTQESSGCFQMRPEFIVQDANRNQVFVIVNPTSQFCDCGAHQIDYTYPITTMDRANVVGSISKQWSGYFQETRTDADNFMITFPADLDVKLKAVLIGGCFLIDFMFYESRARRHHHHNRRSF